jgi:t-SNARE complex subunit (syntaxin)
MIQEDISYLRKSVKKLERMVVKLGTKGEDSDFMERLKSEMKVANGCVRTIIKSLQQQGGNPMVNNLKRDFDREFQKLQGVQKKVEAKEKSIQQVLQKHKRNPFGEPRSAQEQSAIQEQLQEEEIDIQFLEFNEMDINRRHEDIVQIESDAVEVLAMYKDMHEMIHQQQAGLTELEDNTSSARAKLDDGYDELKKAQDLQGKARKKQCCLLLVVLFVLAAVVLFVYLLR